MRRFVAISLSIIVIYVSCKDLLPYAHFYLNKDFIVNTLCINRDKPELKCNGKCYLKKSIQDNKAKEKSKPNPVKEEKLTIVFVPISSTNLNLNPTKNNTQKIICYYKNEYTFYYQSDIFHPPQFV